MAAELDEESEDELAMCVLSAHDAWPSSWTAAMKRSDADEWRKAAQEEIDAHSTNGTWSPCPLPPGKKICAEAL